ncbi:MAG: leucine-rich repeat domain-containing protein, partial [Candidatus Thermochlorobacter sp.]
MKRYFTLLTLLLLVATHTGAQTITVPDANFRNFLVATYLGTSQSGNTVTFTTPSVTSITFMDCSSQNISDLTGIEHFTALTELRCYDNQLTSLDVSNNTALQVLLCQNNQLTSLNVSNNTALQRLDCGDNQLTSLNVSSNTALQILYCYNNQLTSLDVSSNTALTDLRCYDNQLT